MLEEQFLWTYCILSSLILQPTQLVQMFFLIKMGKYSTYKLSFNQSQEQNL